MNAEERKQHIDRIRQAPDRVRKALDGLTESQLDTPYRTGGWTIRQVVHHLADSHMNAFVRMKLVLTEETPALKAYDQDDWAMLPDVTSAPLDGSLRILDGLHERWAILLEDLADANWARTGIHAERGVVTLENLLTTYADHGDKHVEHILKCRRDHGW